jgi:hypothetical protein
MDFMFAPTEAVWLLALIYQPVVLIYYIFNDQARKPYVDLEGARRERVSRVLRPITNIFSLSLSCFTLVVLSKILLMNVYGLEALIYMLGGLLLMTLVMIAYLASFFEALNAKQLVFFTSFVVGAIITYAILIPSGFSLEGFYDGEFYEFIIPFLFPGLFGFIAFVIFVLALYTIKKMGKAKNTIQKLSQPLWNKRSVIRKIFGFYFHLIIWIFLVLETLLNQSGYSILSWVII